MSENNYCPGCGRHCDLDNPHCERGREFAVCGTADEHTYSKAPKQRRANYNALDTDNKLIWNLRDLGHMMHMLFEGKGSQRRILIILLESGGMTQRELTERLGVQPGSASEVIGKLEKAGLIERKASPTDRRTTDIQLTEAGRIQAEDAALQRKIRHQEMFSCLSPDEKETLAVLTEKLNRDWDSRYRKNAAYHHARGEHSHHGHHGHHGGFHC